MKIGRAASHYAGAPPIKEVESVDNPFAKPVVVRNPVVEVPDLPGESKPPFKVLVKHLQGEGYGDLVDGTPLGLPRFCVLVKKELIPHPGVATSCTVYVQHPGARKPLELKLMPRLGYKEDPMGFTFCAIQQDDLPKLKGMSMAIVPEPGATGFPQNSA